ncbi:MAG: pyridoxine 5'-phosphate synthase [Bacteroidales bacterium]|nr:pyridoxine 5'-phosphate synthase [Bacteroidales bacterium]
MTKLSVNINKIATIRNARGGTMPDVVMSAVLCQRFGADGITIHPRPDQRHIRFSDVWEIKPLITTEYNIEGYPSEEFISMVIAVRPDQVTLVPDAHDAITSNAGWDTIKHRSFLKELVERFHEHSIRTSIFVDTNPGNIESAALTGTDRVELYTEPYAHNYPSYPGAAIEPFVRAAETVRKTGMGLNAGHDLNLDNLSFFSRSIPWIDEVSIGHALISDALYMGLEETIKRYREALVH